MSAETLARIAAAMNCAPADGDDLVEAVHLLVAERDAAVAQRDALAAAVREEREARAYCAVVGKDCERAEQLFAHNTRDQRAMRGILAANAICDRARDAHNVASTALDAALAWCVAFVRRVPR